MGKVVLSGPEAGIGGDLQQLAEGVWVTSGRAAVLEGPDGLAVVDPGDESVGSPGEPRGALAETLDLEKRVGKPVRWLVLTHGHPDHTGNLPAFKDRFPTAAVVAHGAGPVPVDVRIVEEGTLPGLPAVRLLPTPGHSSWGDDISLFLPDRGVLLSGDLIQPKGETWEQAFYPSPYPYFTDGGLYCASLERLEGLAFEVLITGHREVRRGPQARAWLQLTLAAIRRVEQAVREWRGVSVLNEAAVEIWSELAEERGIPKEVRRARLEGRRGPSAFASFDLPGIRYYWEQLRSGQRGS